MFHFVHSCSLGFPHVFHMFSMCFPYVFHVFSICFQYVFHVFSICFPYVFHMFSICFPCVFHMFSMCFPYVFHNYHMFPQRITHIQPFHQRHVWRCHGPAWPPPLRPRSGAAGPGRGTAVAGQSLKRWQVGISMGY